MTDGRHIPLIVDAPPNQFEGTDAGSMVQAPPPDLDNFKEFLHHQPAPIIAELLAIISLELFFRADWPGVAAEVRRASDDLANLARHQGGKT